MIRQGQRAEGRPSRPVVNATDNAAREAIAGRALGLHSAARPPGREVGLWGRWITGGPKKVGSISELRRPSPPVGPDCNLCCRKDPISEWPEDFGAQTSWSALKRGPRGSGAQRWRNASARMPQRVTSLAAKHWMWRTQSWNQNCTLLLRRPSPDAYIGTDIWNKSKANKNKNEYFYSNSLLQRKFKVHAKILMVLKVLNAAYKT